MERAGKYNFSNLPQLAGKEIDRDQMIRIIAINIRIVIISQSQNNSQRIVFNYFPWFAHNAGSAR